jgi:hypothetical protein
MRIAVFVLTVAVAVVTATAPARGHHAFTAEFDGNRPVTLRGTVIMMEWINPHSWIHVEIEADDGTVEAWMIECGSPNTLLRAGMTRESILAGMEIVVDGFLAKDGSNTANGRNVTLADGSQLFLGGSSGAGAPR